MEQKRYEEIMKIIEKFNLKSEETMEYMEDCFLKHEIIDYGTRLDQIFKKPSSLFSNNNNHVIEKNKVLEALKSYFNKFHLI